jgi:ribosomal protein S6
MSDTTIRVYELGYILVPTTPETEVEGKIDGLKAVITGVEGNILSTGAPEYIDLAYTMEKNVASKKLKWSQGYFGWIKFDAAPEALEAIKKSLDANLDLIRYILVKTTAENTVIFKKPKIEAKREQQLDEEIEVAEDEVLEEGEEDPALDHEKLPDVQSDIVSEEEEKESI